MSGPVVSRLFLALALLPTLVLARTTEADPASGVTDANMENASVVLLRPVRSVPAMSSAALTQKAWAALEARRYDEAILVAEETENRFGPMADRQQQRLKTFAPLAQAAQFSALNDVATCLFIKGRAYRMLERNDEARQAFLDIIQNYRFAQCWDPKGWFWKVAEAAQDEIHGLDYGVDYGDYTSETLTTQAWKAYQNRKYEAVELYTRKCVELYAETALKMQSELKDFPPKGQENDFWALNDVATSLLIRGKSLQRQRRNREASQVFGEIIEKYPFALCWNPSGHYWRVAEAAQRSMTVYSP